MMKWCQLNAVLPVLKVPGFRTLHSNTGRLLSNFAFNLSLLRPDMIPKQGVKLRVGDMASNIWQALDRGVEPAAGGAGVTHGCGEPGAGECKRHAAGVDHHLAHRHRGSAGAVRDRGVAWQVNEHRTLMLIYLVNTDVDVLTF